MSLRLFLIENWREMFTLTGQHLVLVLISTSIAVLIGVPVGILLTRQERLRSPVLGLANVLQTIPSIALFGFLIPLPFIGGIGARTAIVALVLYSLLPVIRNTVTGIAGVDKSVREAAIAMGMTDKQILWQVELPLAMKVILTGVRVAVVIAVGVATIAAAIGAGGLGTYIFRGLRVLNNNLILAGAVPAALMALAADFGIGLLEKRFDVGARRKVKKQTSPIARFAWAAMFTTLALAIGGYAMLNRGGVPDETITTKENNAASNAAEKGARVIVCAKDFTESGILAEIIAETLEARGLEVERRELSGNLCHDAIVSGQIDVYPEYTGTSYTAILHHQPISDARAVRERVTRAYAEKFNVEVGAPFGFSNDFAILVRGKDARALKLKTISEAAPFATRWHAGFGQDFMSRADGYQGFAHAYNLKFADSPREMDLSLTYRALAAGQVDLIAGNSTDGLIAALDLVQLEDDQHYFPPYEAVVLIRKDTVARVPVAAKALDALRDSISTEEMRRLNYEVDGRKRGVPDVVREWRSKRGAKR